MASQKQYFAVAIQQPHICKPDYPWCLKSVVDTINNSPAGAAGECPGGSQVAAGHSASLFGFRESSWVSKQVLRIYVVPPAGSAGGWEGEPGGSRLSCEPSQTQADNTRL
jgi:hypothetical protein